MPHRGGVSGASLVPNISGLLNPLTESFQARGEKQQEFQKQQDLQREIDILTGGSQLPLRTSGRTGGGVGGFPVSRARLTPEQEAAALFRISQLGGTEKVNSIRQILERRDEQELAATQKETEQATRDAIFLKGIKDPLSRKREITKIFERQVADKVDPTTTLALSNLPPEEQDLMIESQIVQATDFNTLLSNARQEQFTLVRDEQGGIVGQRSSLTGKVIADPRAPEPATKTSLIRNLEAIGIDPLSAEGRDIVKKSLTKPGVRINLSEGLDFKIPPGFMLLDKNDPTKGVTPIPGGPKDSLSGETAAKTQMLRTARKAAVDIEGLIFEEDGSLNRGNLFNAQFNTPFTEGRKLRNKMEFGIQAITRLETGAAMPAEEVENTRTRFMPTIGDTVEIANLKINMFDEFTRGTLKLLDPSGRFDSERFNEELQRRIPQPQRTIDGISRATGLDQTRLIPAPVVAPGVPSELGLSDENLFAPGDLE